MARPETRPTRAQPAEQREWLGGDEPPQPESAAPYPNGNGAYDEPPGLATLDARAPIGFRTPPHNLDAEQALLGAILVNNEAYARVASFLLPVHFYEPVHGRIYAAIMRLVDHGRIADHVTMAEQFDEDEALKGLDGHKYLARIAYAAQTILNAEDYGHLLHDLAIRRSVIALGEAAVNKAYDPTAPETPSQQLEDVRQQAEKLGGESAAGLWVRACDIPAVNLELLEQGLFTPQRWLIDEWLPVGDAGIFAGAGSVGKSYLELIRMVSLVARSELFGFECAEPITVLGYFAEETQNQLAIRLDQICRGYGISPASLEGRLNVVSTKGRHIRLFEADRNALAVTPTDDFKRIVERAKKIGARYIALDNIARYCAIDYHVNNQQVFDLFTYLDQVAAELDGCLMFLTHPSKSGLRIISDTATNVTPYDMVGGCTAFVNAPRVVHTMRWFRPTEDDEPFRLFQKHKRNIGEEFALKLVENAARLVECREQLDLSTFRSRSRSRGAPSSADRTLATLEDMFAAHRREIAIDDLVRECVQRGIVAEAAENSDTWRDRRKTIRAHMYRHRDRVDIRGKEAEQCFALKP